MAKLLRFNVTLILSVCVLALVCAGQGRAGQDEAPTAVARPDKTVPAAQPVVPGTPPAPPASSAQSAAPATGR